MVVCEKKRGNGGEKWRNVISFDIDGVGEGRR